VRAALTPILIGSAARLESEQASSAAATSGFALIIVILYRLFHKLCNPA
jgi:hypothetical protein